MDTYRFYQLDLLGKPMEPSKDFACENDAEAFRMAADLVVIATGSIEIWQGKRLVG